MNRSPYFSFYKAILLTGFILFLSGYAAVFEAEGSTTKLYQGKIIDSHAHYSHTRIKIDEIIALLDEANVSQVVLFGDEKQLRKAKEKYPDRIIPFLSPYGIYRKIGRVKIPEKSLPSIETSLKSGFFKGYGEVLVRIHRLKPIAPKGVNIPVNSKTMLKLFDMVAANNIPINVHVDNGYAHELEKALKHNRKAAIIWAHCGYSNHDVIRRMFENNHNLYADLSVLADPTKKRHRVITNSNGSLKPEWKALFEDFSNRLMLGSDMAKDKRRYGMTPKIILHYRKLLSQLKLESADNIAHKTIRNLLEPISK